MSQRFRYFVLFAAMRTGSNLAERLLNQCKGIQCHGEMFNPGFIGKEGQREMLGLDLTGRERDPHALVAAMIASAGDQLPGFRLFDGHDTRIEREAIADPACAKIILRRNPIDSYVSLRIAQTTGQWLLGPGGKRRSARIRVDRADLLRHLSETEAYYERLRKGLQVAGQTAFEIRYEDLKSLETLNGLARFLGREERITSFDEPIKRQNPEPLREKVENFADIADLVTGPGEVMTQQDSGHGRPMATVTEFVLSDTAAAIFAPIPGTARGPVIAWLRSLGGPLQKELASEVLDDWLDAMPDFAAFTVTEHPLERIYRVFQRRIFGGDHIYPAIQQRLVANYGLALSDAAPTAEETRAAFSAFLRFLKQNLAEQTGLRIDPEWDYQTRHVAAISATLPLKHVLNPTEFAAFARAHAERLSCEPPTLQQPGSGGGLPLRAVINDEITALVSEIYRNDFLRLGYGSWDSTGGRSQAA